MTPPTSPEDCQEKKIDKLLTRVKHNVQLWHDLLWASGGKLELSKCGFHIIFYDFKEDGTPKMRDIGDLIIILKNEKNEDIEIRTKKINKARINLGHWKTPETTPIPKQFLVSLEKAITTSNAIFTSPVTRPEAKMLYQSVYRPTVEYPLDNHFYQINK